MLIANVYGARYILDEDFHWTGDPESPEETDPNVLGLLEVVTIPSLLGGEVPNPLLAVALYAQEQLGKEVFEIIEAPETVYEEGVFY